MADPVEAARHELVTTHLELARTAAAIIHRKVRDHIELDELVAYAQQGLVEAAQRYDASRGASFKTFAWYRVQGAVIDGLRRQTTLPRRTWAKLVALRAASEYLEQRGEREVGARQQGAAPARGVDAAVAIKDSIAAIRTVYLTSLEAAREKGFDAVDPGASAGEQLDRVTVGTIIRDAIERLPERERALMTKHYWEGKNLLEAGVELGISKSWACRLHAQAVERLRTTLATAIDPA